MKTIKRPSERWLTKREMAAVFAVSETQFDRKYARFASETDRQEIDGKLFYKCRALLDCWLNHELNVISKPAEGDPDPLLQGPVTDALEFYRKQKGLQEEIKLEQMRGNTVAVAAIETPLLNLCGVLRRAGDNLARRYGNEAAQVLNEAVDEWEKGCESVVLVGADKGDSE